MPKCPLCLSSKHKFLFYSSNFHGYQRLDNHRHFHLCRCQKCQTIFLKNVSINQLYYQEYYPQNYYRQSLPSFYTQLILATRSKQLTSFFPQFPISILDFGCGDGNFLQSLDSTKFQKYGTDINPQSIKICQQKGIKMINLPTTQKFDLITLNHVLEHLPNPNFIIRQISNNLKPNGLLSISVPNCSSLGFKLGRQRWFHLDSPRHLFIPTIPSITACLGRHNFKIIRVHNNRLEFPLDLFWSVLHHPLRFLIYPLYPLIKFFDPETITVICQKSHP